MKLLALIGLVASTTSIQVNQQGNPWLDEHIIFGMGNLTSYKETAPKNYKNDDLKYDDD
jgi:hypothetical protein